MMDIIIRFFKELFGSPQLKCERVGHKWIDLNESRFEKTTSFRAVADEVSYIVTKCERCEFEKGRSESDRESIQSLTLPSDKMRLLREQGWVKV
jgi:hypothetical protein